MAEMADDHYALDTRRARDLLGWEAQHRFKDELPTLVQSLKDDPPGWYRLPWNLGLSALIGLALLFTQLWPGVQGNLAHAHHVIGSLVLTVVSVAAAEVARPARWLNLLLGAGLMATPFLFSGDAAAMLVSVLAGAALVALSVRRGPIRERYGAWDRVINS